MRTAKPALIRFANEDCKARGAEWVDEAVEHIAREHKLLVKRAFSDVSYI
jgi:hypothetical protein